MNTLFFRPGRPASLRGPLLALAVLALAGCGRQEAGSEHGHEHGHDDEHAEAVERGPRGGRLFADDGIRLELRIEEAGIPPEFRAYLYDDAGAPIVPVAGRLTVRLERFGGRRDSIPFEAAGEFFRGLRTVDEPHSFAAQVQLERDGRRHAWSYEQEEGRVELSAEATAAAGIEVAAVGPRAIEIRVDAPGEVRLNAERVAQIRPRYPGVVLALDHVQGDEVRAGDRLAVVQSNESLTEYEIASPLNGTVVARDIVEGQTVGVESVLYTVADLSRVWVDLALYPQNAGRVRRGQMAHIRAAAGDSVETHAPVSYVGPLLEQDTRVSYGRVVIENAGNRWQPGLFVSASVTVGRLRAPVAVPEQAIVRSRFGPAVFRASAHTFELQPVETGESDGRWTEIRSGLAAGDSIVVEQAYLLKAELGKSEATHDH